jgi:hypothetical protein
MGQENLPNDPHGPDGQDGPDGPSSPDDGHIGLAVEQVINLTKENKPTTAQIYKLKYLKAKKLYNIK